jgi:hypothetical protein
MWMPVMKGRIPDPDPALKTCPMCGSPAFMQEYIDHLSDDIAWSARCSKCPLGIDFVDDDIDFARGLWNRTPTCTEASA